MGGQEHKGDALLCLGGCLCQARLSLASFLGWGWGFPSVRKMWNLWPWQEIHLGGGVCR